MGEVSLPTADVSDVIEQVNQIASRANRLLGRPEGTPVSIRGDLRQAERALAEVRQSLGADSDPQLLALLIRAEQAQLALKDVILSIQLDEIESGRSAVKRLRNTVSNVELAERIPVEAHRMGFSRVLFSRIRKGTWLPCSAFVGNDQNRAEELVEVGTANPRRLVSLSLECDMVRKRNPILVRQPRTNPKVHPELIAVTHTAAYVAAPVFSWGHAIALVHADRPEESSGVDEFDRDALGAFAEGLGIAFERNLIVERLGALRRAAEEYLVTADSIADDLTLEAIELAGPGSARVEQLVAQSEVSHEPITPLEGSPLDRLTSREAEVLRGMAAGKTNAQIASKLYVAEGTVKSHVKNILRKLEAANRTEAVIAFHRANNPWLAPSD